MTDSNNPPTSVSESFELLPSSMQVGETTINTGLELRADQTSRIIRLGFPAFLRNTQRSLTTPETWGNLCQLMSEFGWLLRCHADDLAELGPAQIPLRLGFRNSELPFANMEVQTADLFEVDCQRPDAGWNWPVELGSSERIGSLLASLRAAAGFDTPVGVTLPLGNTCDLRLCLTSTSRPDFVTLVDMSKVLTLGSLHHVRQARSMCQELGLEDFPLLLSSSIVTPHEFVVCLCVGASAMSLDLALEPLLARAKPAKPSLSNSLLDGLANKTDESTMLTEMRDFISDFQQQVASASALVGAESLTQLMPQCLWAAESTHAGLLSPTAVQK